MKRIPPSPARSPADLAGPRYWRSLDDLLETPAFRDWAEREFPQGAAELEGVNRRQFMKLMGASFGLAGLGLAGCRRPESQLKPFARESLREMPGLPVFYASSLPGSRENLPLVVETHGARPTKIEGNEKFPGGGATDLLTQASLLDLYDPDRATRSSRGTRPLPPAEVHDLLRSIHDKFLPVGGQGLALLAQPSTSPTRERLLQEWRRKFPRALWAEYEAVPQDGPERALAPLFGGPRRVRVDYAAARRILALDADFLGLEPGKIPAAAGYASGRRVRDQDEARRMSRLYAVESRFSLTGTMADHRLRLATAHLPAFAARFAAELLDQLGVERDFAAQLRHRAGPVEVDPAWLAACAQDLREHRGSAVIVAGSHLSAEIHLLVAFLNDLLGATGHTVHYLTLPPNPAAGLPELSAAIRSGAIETLLLLGGNPVFDAPADLAFADLLRQVPEVIRHGYHFDETSLAAGTHLAATHFLESWGDGRSHDGTLVPVQPVILPLFEGLSELEILARLDGQAAPDPYALVQATHAALVPSADPAHAFAGFLATGFASGTAFPLDDRRMDPVLAKTLLATAAWTAPAVSAQSLEVLFPPDAKLWDGRYANNGWLQECPEPMSRLTWDNAILISPALAEHLGFDTPSGTFLIGGGVARSSANLRRGREIAPLGLLTLGDTRLEGPVHILPGLADWTVVLPLGYGRRKVGRVGQGSGFDAYPLRTTAALHAATGATLALDPERTRRLACAQDHWSMEGRDSLREGNVEQFLENPRFVAGIGVEAHSPPIYGKDQDRSLQEKVTTQPRGHSAYETPVFTAPQQWGMSVDLNTCIGCQACVVACQSENNIPIVGKDQVLRGREMHWIRIDRYFASGDLAANRTTLPRDPQASLLPMMCQHCEMAPCEQVCPVNATVHDEQGLNVMAYNRCVGTRYCANNCPYKVRRFNFFDWNKREIGHFYEGAFGPDRDAQGTATELRRMRANPEVTVRMRGVMEKCTFCQQRIQNAKIAQKTRTGLVDGGSDDVKVPDGLLQTACQQVCPTGAIVFGDLADPASAVSRSKDNDRDYAVLGYLNIRPRTTYLARLRNPNPAMPDYRHQPHALREYAGQAHGGGHGDSHGAAESHSPGAGHGAPPAPPAPPGGDH